MVVSGLTAMAAVGAAIVDHGLHRRCSEMLDGSVYLGSGDRLSVALTFDDGPSPQTPDLLEYLEQQRISATFFQCGMNAERYPDLCAEVHAGGHEIGNHSWSHRRMDPSLRNGFRLPSPRSMYRELALTQTILTEICKEPPRLFRPPFGQRWIGLDAVRRRMGLIGVQWTVIGHDWEWAAERVSRYVLAGAVPGAIVCLHDGRDVQPDPDVSEMIKALKDLVPKLRDRGYSFETVSHLMLPSGAHAPVPVF